MLGIRPEPAATLAAPHLHFPSVTRHNSHRKWRISLLHSWASGWRVLFTINKGIKLHWVWVQCSQCIRSEKKDSVYEPVFSQDGLNFLQSISSVGQFRELLKISFSFHLYLYLRYPDVLDCFSDRRMIIWGRSVYCVDWSWCSYVEVWRHRILSASEYLMQISA